MSLDPNIGAAVGNLVLVAPLGSGGMGTVYRAEHRALKTPYAVKVLHRQFSRSPETVQRFRREAVACSQLRHENVVFVTDFGLQTDLGIYIVMEYLEGDSLKQVLKQKGRLPLGRVSRIIEQVCDAMAAAHRLEIVHRDLKPDNILVLRDELRRDFIKVLDFGIADIRGSGDGDLQEAGLTAGTPAYISPEQAVGNAGTVGPAADIYCLGVILFELLTGALPFPRGANDYDQIAAHVTTPAPPLSSRYPALGGTKIEALVGSMLEKQPQKRPASMLEVKARLHESVRELQERGDPEAFYEGEGVPSVIPAAPSGPVTPAGDAAPGATLPIGGLVRQIQKEAAGSPEAVLLQAMPNAASGNEAVAVALIAVLQTDILDVPIESDRFKQAVKHLGLLLEAVILAHGGSSATEPQQKVFRLFKNLLTLLPRERQGPVLDSIQGLVHHPLFPRDALPKEDRGGWLKSVMQKEIKLSREAQPAQPQRPAATARPGGPPTDPAFRALYDKGMNFFLQERFEDAIRELKAAYFMLPYDPILFTIGGAYRSLKQPREALEYYERYQHASPNLRPDARARLESAIAEVKAQLAGPGGAAPAEEEPAAEAPAFGEEGGLSLSLEGGPSVEPQSAPPSFTVMATPPPRPAVTPAPRPPATLPTPPPRPAVVPAPPQQPAPAEPEAPSAADLFDAHYSRATELARAGRYEEAIADYAAAYRIDADPALLFHIAWAYRGLGRPKEALQCFLRYQQAEPELRPEAAARLAGLIAEAQGQLQPSAPPAPPSQPVPALAQPAASQPAPAVQPPPSQPAPAVTPAPPPDRSGPVQAPAAAEPAAPAPDPASYAEHHARAIGHHKAGRYEAAIEAFLAAYGARPVAALLFNIAATYRIMKRPREALEYFEKFAAAETDMAEAMQIKLSNLKAEARSQIEAAEGRAPGAPFFAK